MKQRVGMRNRGFTIVELLIVIVVIGILAAITVVAFNGVQARATFAKSQQDLSSINKAILAYHAVNGYYPRSTSSCHNTWCGWGQVTGNDFIPGLSPAFIQSIPQMPSSTDTSNTFLYRSEDGVNYKLMRYSGSAGLPTVERNSPLADPARNQANAGAAWGYWTPGAVNW